ncbi:MAG: flagellar basal body rod protein FlgC [Deltaproteobacteria bacterium]|nr:flagellar basal body rod protein FlgC [Deltaproteobacteria bacterium]
MFTTFAVSASGMEAQRIRLNAISSNLANVNTTRGTNGEPYRRRDVVFEAMPSFSSGAVDSGLIPVKVKGFIKDTRPFTVIYNPGHSDADKEGYLKMPNVNPIEEMINMVSAVRAYDANAAAFKSSKEMMNKALEIGR